MSTLIVWEFNGATTITAPADPAKAADVALSLPAGSTVVVADKAALPADRWSDAWRVVGGVVSVNLAAARAQRKRELLGKRAFAMLAIGDRIDAADDNGQAVRLAALKGKRAALRALDTTIDAQLAAVADLQTLDTFAPAILADPDAQ